MRRFYDRGLTTAISEAKSEDITSREASDLELLYYCKIIEGLNVGFGGRYQTELTRSFAIDAPSTRYYLLFAIRYFFPSPIDEFPGLYVFLGGNYGYGSSSTKSAAAVASGVAQIFPGVSGGVEYYFQSGFALNAEAGVEAISIREQFPNGETQGTNQVNSRMGLGISAYF
ncbi:MAG: hypothetical protein HQK53_01660 [Oligoflexia bacterium]|nr:hypothetical protein [Oligoflexia bacterium]